MAADAVAAKVIALRVVKLPRQNAASSCCRAGSWAIFRMSYTMPKAGRDYESYASTFGRLTRRRQRCIRVQNMKQT